MEQLYMLRLTQNSEYAWKLLNMPWQFLNMPQNELMSLNMPEHGSTVLNVPEYPWKCLNKLWWGMFSIYLIILEISQSFLNMPQPLNMPGFWICGYSYRNIIVIVIDVIILEFFSAGLLHTGAPQLSTSSFLT